MKWIGGEELGGVRAGPLGRDTGATGPDCNLAACHDGCEMVADWAL